MYSQTCTEDHFYTTTSCLYRTPLHTTTPVDKEHIYIYKKLVYKEHLYRTKPVYKDKTPSTKYKGHLHIVKQVYLFHLCITKPVYNDYLFYIKTFF